MEENLVTNADLAHKDKKLWDQAIGDTQKFFVQQGEDPDDMKIKDIYTFLRNQPFPYKLRDE